MKGVFDIKIIVYIIIIVLLVIAFISVNVYKDLTVKENRTKGYNETNRTGLGFCNVPQDCENQGLVHIQCVGNWVCEQNRCGWVCSAEVAPQQTGGLSGSTVECYEDSHCQPGVCADGSTYKRYRCLNNKCVDINYFADPCIYG